MDTTYAKFGDLQGVMASKILRGKNCILALFTDHLFVTPLVKVLSFVVLIKMF